MRRDSLFVFILFVCLSIHGQTANEITQKLQEIRQENGDSIARNFLVKNHSIFTNENEEFAYILFWGLLTSNMWNSNPSEPLRVEYKQYLDDAFDDEIKSEDYIPNKELLPSIWQLAKDYYNILYREGDRENVLILLKCIHRWFLPYPDSRNTIGYAQSLLDLCLLLVRDMHKYEEGKPYAEEYLEVAKKVYGEKSAQYAMAIYNMHIFPTNSITDKAAIIKRAITIYKDADNHNPVMLAQMDSLYNAHMISLTGVVNSSNIIVPSNGILSIIDCGKLVVAEKGNEALNSLLYHKNKFLQDQYIDTLMYSSVITYLISAYIEINDLVAAQKEIEEFNLKIGIDNLPLPSAQIFYSSAGLVAMRLKDYQTALRYCHAACKISEQVSIPAMETCKVLTNLSVIYAEAANSISKDFLLDAKWYIDEAIAIFKEEIGPLKEHGAVGLNLLNTKAMVYDAIGDRDGTIETYEMIVSEFADNPDVKRVWNLAVNNLAASYLKDHPQKAVELLESLSSENKEYSMLFKLNLALAYYVTGNHKVEEILKEYNKVCYNNCMEVFNFFTIAEREDYWTGTSRELLVYNNLIADKYPNIADVAYDNLLFVKGLKLASSDILKDIVDHSTNIELKKRYNRITELREAISYRSQESDSMQIWKSQLKEEERGILGIIPDYKERLLSSFHSWSEIKEKLKEDEVAVEFTYIPKMKGWENAVGYYGAFIVTNKSKKPELVILCNVDNLNGTFIGKTSDALQISKLYKESTSIYDNLWGKLEEYIKDKKTIYFSPTGPLNLLNHEALVMPDGQIFGDKYNLIRLSSTDKILARTSTNAKLQSAVVYGGIQYDLSVADMNEAAKKYKQSHGDDSFLMAMRSEDERGRWNYLPGTKTESDNIYKLLTSSKIHATLLQESAANEESFKSLNGHSPNIIHLSTHGYFLDTNQKVMANPFMSNVGNYSEKEDQLIRTGLLMAGSNNVWCGREKVSGIEDGILTADEISRLDLSGTNLVVLSACETAKGQVDEIDGVLGLQRGFKKAGAKSIMMSLWKVSDAVTSMLMTEFYSNLGKDMSTKEALKAATRKIRSQYPDPYFWAAFVVLD